MARTKQTARKSTGGKAPREPPRERINVKGRRSPFVKEKGFCYELPLLVEGEVLFTELDTCAASCVISYSVLQSIAKKVKANASESTKSQYGSFVIACEEDWTDEMIFVSLAGKKIQSDGSVTLQCAFTDDSTNPVEITLQVCSILPDGISLVLSSSFIEHFKLFSDNSWRLISRPDYAQVHPPRIMRMAPARAELPIYLGSYKVNACADTGADLNVITANFSRRCRKPVHNLGASDPTHVEFFDRTQAPILGKIFARVFFQIKRESDNEPGDNITEESLSMGKDQQMTTFYVLSDIISEVTLGAQFLDSVGAFTQNVSRLQHIADEQRFAVIRKSRKRNHEAIEDAHPQTPYELNDAQNRLISVHANHLSDIEKCIQYVERQIASTPTGHPSLVTLRADLDRKQQAKADLEQTLQHDLQYVSDRYNQHIAATVASNVPFNGQTPTASFSGSIDNVEKANLIFQNWMHRLKPQIQQFLDDPPRDLMERRRRHQEFRQDLLTNIIQPAKEIGGLPFSSAQNILKQIKKDISGVLKTTNRADWGA